MLSNCFDYILNVFIELVFSFAGTGWESVFKSRVLKVKESLVFSLFEATGMMSVFNHG